MQHPYNFTIFFIIVLNEKNIFWSRTGGLEKKELKCLGAKRWGLESRYYIGIYELENNIFLFIAHVSNEGLFGER